MFPIDLDRPDEFGVDRKTRLLYLNKEEGRRDSGKSAPLGRKTMGTVSQLRPGGAVFDLRVAMRAARAFEGPVFGVAIVLLEATKPDGTVTMTIDELGRRTKRKRGSVQLAVQALTKSGALARNRAVKWHMTWNLEGLKQLSDAIEVQDFAAEQAARVGFSQDVQLSSETELLRALFDAEKHVRTKIAQRTGKVWSGVSCTPQDAGRRVLRDLVTASLERFGCDPPRLLRAAWWTFLTFDGRTDRGGQWIDYKALGHPASYLPWEWLRNPVFHERLTKRLDPRGELSGGEAPKPPPSRRRETVDEEPRTPSTEYAALGRAARQQYEQSLAAAGGAL